MKNPWFRVRVFGIGLVSAPLFGACSSTAGSQSEASSALATLPSCASESPSCTSIDAPGALLVDGAGSTWALITGSDGALVVTKDGAPAGYSDRVVKLAYVSHVVSQENADGNWWQWQNGGWVAEQDPTGSCSDGGGAGENDGGAGGGNEGGGGGGAPSPSLLNSQGRAFAFGWNAFTVANNSGADGECFAANDGGNGNNYGNPDFPTQLAAMKALGATSVQLVMTQAYDSGSGRWSPSYQNQTRAQWIAGGKAAFDAGLDVWVKINEFPDGGFNASRNDYTPPDPSQFFTASSGSILSTMECLIDALEAVAPPGKHVWGASLTTEMNAISKDGTYAAYYAQIRDALHQRYPSLKVVTNAPEAIYSPGHDPDPTYASALDAISATTYYPVQTDTPATCPDGSDATQAPSGEQIYKRLAVDGQACGGGYGGGNYIGSMFAGTSVMSYYRHVVESTGKPIVVSEDGMCSQSNATATPGSCGNGGTADDAGWALQADWFGPRTPGQNEFGALQAWARVADGYDPTSAPNNQVLVFFWAWTVMNDPYGNMWNYDPGTNGYDVQLKARATQQLMNNGLAPNRSYSPAPATFLSGS